MYILKIIIFKIYYWENVIQENCFGVFNFVQIYINIIQYHKHSKCFNFICKKKKSKLHKIIIIIIIMIIIIFFCLLWKFKTKKNIRQIFARLSGLWYKLPLLWLAGLMPPSDERDYDYTLVFILFLICIKNK